MNRLFEDSDWLLLGTSSSRFFALVRPIYVYLPEITEILVAEVDPFETKPDLPPLIWIFSKSSLDSRVVLAQ